MENKDIKKLVNNYGIFLLVLFGSRGRGDFRLHSDADVAYLSLKPLTLLEESAFAVELATKLGATVDLINIRKSSPLLLYKVFKDGKALYEKEKGYFNLSLARVYRNYEDTTALYKAKAELLNLHG